MQDEIGVFTNVRFWPFPAAGLVIHSESGNDPFRSVDYVARSVMESIRLKGTTPLRILAIIIVIAFAFSIGVILLFVGKSDSLPVLLKGWLFFFLIAIAIPLAAIGALLMIRIIGLLVKNLFLMVSEIDKDVGRFYWRIGFNGFNVLFFPRYLSSEGLEARREVIRSYFLFFAYMLFWIPLILMMEFWGWK